MLHLSASCNYYLYSGVTDMRKGFDSLTGIVKNQMSLNALSGSVYIFLNRRRTHIKLLLWDGDGFAIYYKRLEKGTYELPVAAKNNNEFSITHEALQHILQGVCLKSVRKRKRYQQIDKNCG